MAAPTPEQMRKFFNKFFDMVGSGRIHSRNMNAVMADMEFGIARAWPKTSLFEILEPLSAEQQQRLMRPVSELGWAKHSRVPNALRNARIEQVHQLTVHTEPTLLLIKGIARKAINEIRSNLSAHGLSLGMRLAPLQTFEYPSFSPSMRLYLVLIQ